MSNLFNIITIIKWKWNLTQKKNTVQININWADVHFFAYHLYYFLTINDRNVSILCGAQLQHVTEGMSENKWILHFAKSTENNLYYMSGKKLKKNLHFQYSCSPRTAKKKLKWNVIIHRWDWKRERRREINYVIAYHCNNNLFSMPNDVVDDGYQFFFVRLPSISRNFSI